MAPAKSGDTVKVHYTGRFADGTQFDSSADGEPIEFTIGQGRLIAGFEESVIGMTPGESKEVAIASEKAYGPYREELVMAVERERFPEQIVPEVGQHLRIGQEDGRSIMVQVTNVSETQVTLDANHPLAGKDLLFQIHLVEVS